MHWTRTSSAAAALLLVGCAPAHVCDAPDVTEFVDEGPFDGQPDNSNRLATRCGGEESNEFIGVFEIEQGGEYLFLVHTAPGGFPLVLSLFTDCENAAETVFACASGTVDAPPELREALPAGRYFLAIDGAGEYAEPFGLEIERVGDGDDDDDDGADDDDAADDDDGADDDDAVPGDCISLDRIETEIVPPAGVALGFRAMGCDGTPIAALTPADVTIINDETGVAFGDASEGDATSDVGANDQVEAFSVLALDFSSSIFAAGAEQDVVNGALAYIDATVVNPGAPLDHEVALIAFGAPDELELISDFTSDPVQLQSALSAALARGSRGTTDLYGAYLEALELVEGPGSPESLVERFVVVMTDGTHEAGDTENLRAQALSALALTDATVYSIGLDGDYDAEALRELASAPSTFLQVSDSAELGQAFGEAAERAFALAQSNYVVGICTPVALGLPTLTLEVDVGGAHGSVTVPYSTSQLTGAIDQCNADVVAAALGD